MGYFDLIKRRDYERVASYVLEQLKAGHDADLPGIDPAHLEVRVDNHVLTLWGQTQYQMPGDLRYREYTLVSFFRQFELGERIDQEGIRADLQQGVLTLTLPKAAKAQPRAITVNAA